MTDKLPYPLDQLLAEGQVVTCSKGDILKKQFSKVDTFYILLDGTVHFHQSLNANEKEMLAGMSQSVFAPIGMDAFIPPYRNETTAIVESDQATVIKWETNNLTDFLDSHLDIAVDFFKFLNEQSHKFVEDTSELFANTSAALQTIEKDTSSEGYLSHVEHDELDKVILLLQSSFFEEFEEEHLAVLAKYMERREYLVDEIIIGQDEIKAGIYLLESGEVQYSRVNFSIETNRTYKVPFRSISTPGYLISSSSLLGVKSAMTSFVTKQASIFYIPEESLTELCRNNRIFAMAFQKRILWLINNQLRAVRTRLIATQFNEELLVVDTLIGSNSTKLSVHSLLHAVPVLLKDKMSIPKAIEILHQVELKGKGPEKNLASLCLDNLHSTLKESHFYYALQNIYSQVAENDPDKPDDEVQMECLKASKAAFSIPSIFTKGLEHLPMKSGCVFIYNHLLNDPYYTLPNQFQITLDSHYLSSLIFDRYGAQALRVVRIGKAEEFAHQNYYGKLGFIDVYTKDSDEFTETHSQKESRHKSFFDKINLALNSGKNLIISPEGASYQTEVSPGIFKSGIFKVIQKMEKEPLIVPIVMANFDKRITNYKYACEIKEPFMLSKKMKAYGTDNIKDFLKQYQQEFKKDLKELIQLTDSENSVEQLFVDEIAALKEKLNNTSEENATAFYGSSTIRLWETLEADLADKKAVNLGFGGSSYQWCVHYFDELFENFHPESFVLYGGDNDLSNGQTPENVANTLELLIEKIKAHSPGISITIISIKPSPSREYLIPDIKHTNDLIKELVERLDNMHWIETYESMVYDDGRPRSDLFVEDMLHLNPKGYKIWKECVREQLI